MVFEHAITTYTKNTGMLSVFSLSFLLGLLMLVLVSDNTFTAIGGVFLRFLSIPQIGIPGYAIIGIAVLLSTYLVSFGIVAVNLTVKKERVQINLTSEILNNIAKNTLVIFLILLFLFAVQYAVQIFLMELQAPYPIAGLLAILIYLPTFYVAPAIVIDEMKPMHAIMASVSHIKKYPMRVVKWLVLGLVLMLATSAISYVIIPAYFQLVTLLVNSLFIMPFLLVYQAHNYIEKYGILKDARRKEGRTRHAARSKK